MEKTQKINFNGGFVELFVPQPPTFEQKKWRIRLYGKVFASDGTTRAEGRRILIEKGFTTNGNKMDEYYKVIYFNFF